MDSKATMLWHEIWFQGPEIGVCEYQDEKMFYARNSKGEYELRRFVEDGYKRFVTHQESYRNLYGGVRDHDPALFSPSRPANLDQSYSYSKIFDFANNVEKQVYITLKSSDFKWFLPSRKS